MIAIFVFGLHSNPFSDKIRLIKENKALVLLPCYFFLLCIGVLYSNDVGYGWSNIERSIGFLFAPLLLATSRRLNKSALARMGWLVTINTLLAALYCVVRNVLWFRENDMPLNRFFDWEYSYRHLSDFVQLHPTYFSILVLISIYMFIFFGNYRRWVGKIVNILSLIFLVMFLILLGSKIGLTILFLFINVSLIIFLTKRAQLWLILGYIFLNFAMLAIAFKTHVIYWRFRMAFENLKNTLNGSELSDYRVLHWKCAIRAIVEKPLFGWGTGDSYYPLDRCYNMMGMSELLGYNAHNLFLDAWIKIGLAGLALVFMSLVYPLYQSIKNRHYLFVSIFSMYIMVAMTESIFSVQKGISLFSILSSIYLGHICVLKYRDSSSSEVIV
jgi:O-antigen ligase